MRKTVMKNCLFQFLLWPTVYYSDWYVVKNKR